MPRTTRAGRGRPPRAPQPARPLGWRERSPPCDGVGGVADRVVDRVGTAVADGGDPRLGRRVEMSTASVDAVGGSAIRRRASPTEPTDGHGVPGATSPATFERTQLSTRSVTLSPWRAARPRDRRPQPAHGRGHIGAALLRGAGADPRRADERRAAAVPPRGDPPGLVHPHRPAGRALARRDRRRHRHAARPPHPDA